MTDLISFTQNAFALYPNADAVDAWADRLLERAAHTEANAAFSRYTPIRTSFGNGPNALASRYVPVLRILATRAENPRAPGGQSARLWRQHQSASTNQRRRLSHPPHFSAWVRHARKYIGGNGDGGRQLARLAQYGPAAMRTGCWIACWLSAGLANNRMSWVTVSHFLEQARAAAVRSLWHRCLARAYAASAPTCLF